MKSVDDLSLTLKEHLGFAKPSTMRRTQSGTDKKSSMDTVKDSIKSLSRTVMRNPEKEVVEQLFVLHQKMKENFLDMSDEAITWLLGGSAEMARGGFGDTKDSSGIVIKTGAQKFKEFLETDPATLPTQSLLTRIETIATAMGYRKIHASWVAKPWKPETEEQTKMDEKIQALMDGRVVRAIGEIYPERAADSIANPVDTDPNLIVIKPEDVSSASEVEEEDWKPEKRIPPRHFRRYSDTHRRKLSWIGESLEDNIPVRGHTSGTAPLVLSALDGLFASGDTPNDWFNDDANAKKLCGALVLPTFNRGDYHTISETAAGIRHFLIERAIKNDPDITNLPMTPKEALLDACDMLESACASDLGPEINAILSAISKKDAADNDPLFDLTVESFTSKKEHGAKIGIDVAV